MQNVKFENPVELYQPFNMKCERTGKGR